MNGDTVLYLDGNTIYLHASEPIPLVQVESKTDLANFSMSGSTLFLNVPEDAYGLSEYIINIDLSSNELVGSTLLQNRLPQRYQADSYEYLNIIEEQKGEYSEVVSSYMERYSWAGDLIAKYPEFDKPSYVNISCTTVVGDKLYYVAVGDGPSVLKILLPIQ